MRVVLIGILLAFGLPARLPAAAAQPFKVGASLEAVPGTGTALAVAFTVPAGHYLYADQIQVELAGGRSLSPREIPPAKQKTDAFLGTEVGVYDHDVTLRYLVAGDVSGPLEVSVSYQGCSPTLCFLPATATFTLSPGPARAPATAVGATVAAPGSAAGADWREAVRYFRVVGTQSGFLTVSAFLRFLDDAAAGRGAGEDRLSRILQERGVWLLLLLILLGGLALNLTPCVLPMIPVNIAIIGAGAQAGSRARGFVLGAVYGAGIALVYGLLGLAVVLTGAKFGQLNSSAWFNFGIAILFAALALAMFDVYLIDFSRFQSRLGTDEAKRGRLWVALLLGGVAALLAGACVAPVVISVLLLAARLYAAGSPAALLLPFVLGLGMALPWPLVGAGFSLLPKPGKWMNRVKVAFGVFILLMAVWYAVLGVRLLRARGPADTAGQEDPPADSAHAGWHTTLEQGLAAARQQQRPVFIDFWASWCKNCLEMDASTFRDPEVVRRLHDYVRVKFAAEDLRAPEIKAVLDHFGVIGLPTYIILHPVAPPVPAVDGPNSAPKREG